MGKPTIEELERILDGNALPIITLPNGEIKLDYERCAHRSECHASKKEEIAPSASSNSDYEATIRVIKEYALVTTEYSSATDVIRFCKRRLHSAENTPNVS